MQSKLLLLFLAAALQAATGLTVSTRDTTIASRERVPNWSVTFYSSQDCDENKRLFTDTDDDGKECTELPQPAYSARFNGGGVWGGLLYYQAECSGGSGMVGPDDSGCVLSVNGWRSYEVGRMFPM
jgi:hypothetical protein